MSQVLNILIFSLENFIINFRSCGIVLVAMLAGELPWDKPVYECGDYVSWTKFQNYQKTPWCKIENTALSLLRNILKEQPEERFSIREIKQSTWFAKINKAPAYAALHTDEMSGFLSQPTYFYLNDSASSSTSANASNIMMSTELEVTDSKQNCECSSSSSASSTVTGSHLRNLTNHLESFSQPISTENMYLNSQAAMNQTQTQCSQSPLLKLVKRMTRMFVHLNIDACTDELKKLFEKFMYDFRISVINSRQRQITVVTLDKRQTMLTFKVNIIEMMGHQSLPGDELHSQSQSLTHNEVLVDFRLSKGDGLEFKKIFLKIKTSLNSYVCKRYVFVNSNMCCERRVQQ